MTITLSLLLVAIVAVVAVAITLDALSLARRRAAVAPLRPPRIVELPDRPVLQILATGDPNLVAGKAFALLMRAYFRLPGVPHGGPHMPAPRARWAHDLATPRPDWRGAYALPVPDGTSGIATVESGGMRAELTTWHYGRVAEILHEGSYADEAPTVQRLMRFVHEHGFVPAGEHEEEYVVGPGPLGRGDPKRYLTILRYPVRPSLHDS